MKPYCEVGGITIYHGDCRELMAEMEPNSVDAIVTDPPYGLEFMGVGWDTLRENGRGRSRTDFDVLHSKEHPRKATEQAAIRHKKNRTAATWHQCWAETAYRVAKPGAHLLAFGGTRTHHRLMCAIEDAGWEIRDCLMWIFGSGFPKSLDVGKAIDKAAGAEREVVGTWNMPGRGKRSKEQEYGLTNDTGDITAPATDAARQWDGWGTALKPAYEPIILARKPLTGTVAGNVQDHGTGALNIDGCRVNPGEPIPGGGNRKAHNSGRFGAHETKGTRPLVQPHSRGRWPANVVLDEEAAAMLDEQSGTLETHSTGTHHTGEYGSVGVTGWRSGAKYEGSAGGASRFFYCAKASRSERGADNDHPTVKPLSLMQWLCTLVTPPGGLILDPFMGSGTTILAAHELNLRAVGIDLEEKHCEIAVQRLGQGVLDLGDAAS